MTLVLSLFPGLDFLGHAFEAEGYCVVRGPDPILGGDIAHFHPPRDTFDGIIGGPPCQTFSGLSNLTRAQGYETRFGDLIPEFVRVVELALPTWFLMENVPKATEPNPTGYSVTPFDLDNSWLGERQRRRRRFWFGLAGDELPPNLRRWIPGVALECAEVSPAILGDPRSRPVKLGGSGKPKVISGRHEWGRKYLEGNGKVPAVTGAHSGAKRSKGGHLVTYQIEDMLELQGFARDLLDHSPMTKVGKRTAIANGVPLAMGQAVASAIREALTHR